MEVFGYLADGRRVERYRLQNAHGVAVDILTLGGIVQRFFAPDRDGRPADITLGYPHLADYWANPQHLGCLIGRCANRILDGKVEIDGRTFWLARNRGRDTLHGGEGGFHRAVWVVEGSSATHLSLSHESPDGDEGFPGRLQVKATYSLGEDNSLRLDMEATTDAPTIINLTNHAYWNLAGEAAGSIEDHRLTIAADAYTPMTDRYVPTGELRPVDGSPFDFRASVRLGDAMARTDDAQIKLSGGVNHNFVLGGAASNGLRPACRLEEPTSGRMLEISTSEPGLQVYTGNSLSGGPRGKSGNSYTDWEGVALETQHFPDAPHHPDFPSIVLRPGHVWRSTTVFRAGLTAL